MLFIRISVNVRIHKNDDNNENDEKNLMLNIRCENKGLC